MTGPADEHQRTMAFAEIALGQIKALHQPATPRNYEVWYAYATGYHPSLNQKINETLKQSGGLSESDLEQIYETYLSPARLTERIDKVGSQVKGEIEQVMAMIDAAAGSASSYTESLVDMSEKLGLAAARACAPSSNAWCRPKDMEEPTRSWKRLTLEAGNRRSCSKPRGGPHESLTDPLTSWPTASSSTPLETPSATRAPRTSRCR
jgi:diguanylate cyclase